MNSNPLVRWGGHSSHLQLIQVTAPSVPYAATKAPNENAQAYFPSSKKVILKPVAAVSLSLDQFLMTALAESPE